MRQRHQGVVRRVGAIAAWLTAVAALTVTVPPAASSPAGAAAGTSAGVVSFGAGGFEPLVPARILDTRDGTGAPAGPVGPGGVIELVVAGRGGVPSIGAGAVVLNVVATEPSADSYLTAWPTGVDRPLAANLNIAAGQTVGNLVVVKVGAGGRVSLYNLSGRTHLVADVQGWFPEGGALSPMTPSRLLDTRTGIGAPIGAVGPGSVTRLQVAGRAGMPATGVGAVVLNVAVTQPSAAGYLTVYPTGVDRPLAANLNFTAGQTVPNLVIAKVGDDGGVNLYNYAGSTHIVADVAGWFPVGSGFNGLPPARVLDTRDGTGTGTAAPVAAGGIVSLQVTGRGGIPDAGVGAVVVNVAVTEPTADSFITVWPSGVDRPLAVNLNMRTGQTVPNLVIAKVGTDGRINLFNYGGSTHIVADVAGWFPATANGAGTTIDVRPGTVLAGAGDVVAVTGASDTGGTIILAASADVPPVGGHLAVAPHPAAPDGVFGKVTATTPNADGTTTVTFVPGVLEQAFNDLVSSGSQSVPSSPSPVAAARNRPPGLLVPHSDGPAAPARPGGGRQSFDLGALDCTGDVTNPISLPAASINFSEFDHDIDLSEGHVRVEVGYEIKLTAAVGAKGAVTCEASIDFLPPIPIPFGTVDLIPKASVTISAEMTASATLTAGGVLGFDRTDGHWTNLSDADGFDADATYDLNLPATAKIRFEYAAEFKLFGLAGFKVSAGIDNTLQVDLQSVPCVLGAVQASIDLGAVVGRWGVDWEFTFVTLSSPKYEYLKVVEGCPNEDVRWVGHIAVTSTGPSYSYDVRSSDGTWIGTYSYETSFAWRLESGPTGDTLLNTNANNTQSEGIAATLSSATETVTWTHPGESGECDRTSAVLHPNVGWYFESGMFTEPYYGTRITHPAPGSTVYLWVFPAFGYSAGCTPPGYVPADPQGGFATGTEGGRGDNDFGCLAPAVDPHQSGNCFLPVVVSEDGQRIRYQGTLSGTYDDPNVDGVPASQVIDIDLEKVVDTDI